MGLFAHRGHRRSRRGYAVVLPRAAEPEPEGALTEFSDQAEKLCRTLDSLGTNAALERAKQLRVSLKQLNNGSLAPAAISELYSQIHGAQQELETTRASSISLAQTAPQDRRFARAFQFELPPGAGCRVLLSVSAPWRSACPFDLSLDRCTSSRHLQGVAKLQRTALRPDGTEVFTLQFERGVQAAAVVQGRGANGEAIRAAVGGFLREDRIVTVEQSALAAALTAQAAQTAQREHGPEFPGGYPLLSYVAGTAAPAIADPDLKPAFVELGRQGYGVALVGRDSSGMRFQAFHNGAWLEPPLLLPAAAHHPALNRTEQEQVAALLKAAPTTPAAAPLPAPPGREKALEEQRRLMAETAAAARAAGCETCTTTASILLRRAGKTIFELQQTGDAAADYAALNQVLQAKTTDGQGNEKPAVDALLHHVSHHQLLLRRNTQGQIEFVFPDRTLGSKIEPRSTAASGASASRTGAIAAQLGEALVACAAYDLAADVPIENAVPGVRITPIHRAISPEAHEAFRQARDKGITVRLLKREGEGEGLTYTYALIARTTDSSGRKVEQVLGEPLSIRRFAQPGLPDLEYAAQRDRLLAQHLAKTIGAGHNFGNH